MFYTNKLYNYKKYYSNTYIPGYPDQLASLDDSGGRWARITI